MQSEPTAISQHIRQSNTPSNSSTPNQDGFHQLQHGRGSGRLRHPGSGSSLSSVPEGADDGLDPDQLGRRLLGLGSGRVSPNSQRVVAGQRVIEYENALLPAAPRRALGFKVVKRPDASNDGMKLTDFPNGMLLCSL